MQQQPQGSIMAPSFDLTAFMKLVEEIPEAAPSLYRAPPTLFNPQVVHSILFENLYSTLLPPPQNNNVPELNAIRSGLGAGHSSTGRVDMVTQLLLGLPTDAPLVPAVYSAPLVDREALVSRLDTSVRLAVSTAASVAALAHEEKEDALTTSATQAAAASRRAFAPSANANNQSHGSIPANNTDPSLGPVVPRSFTDQAAELMSDAIITLMADTLAKLSKASDQSKGLDLLRIAKQGEQQGTEAIVAATSDPQGVFDSLNELARFRERMQRNAQQPSLGIKQADAMEIPKSEQNISNEMMTVGGESTADTVSQSAAKTELNVTDDPSMMAAFQRPRRAVDEALDAAFGGARRRPRPVPLNASSQPAGAMGHELSGPQSGDNAPMFKTFPSDTSLESEPKEITLSDFISVLERDPVLVRSHALKVARLSHEQVVRRDSKLF